MSQIPASVSISVYALPPNVYDDFAAGRTSYGDALDHASAEFADDVSWQAIRHVLDDDDLFFGGEDSPVDRMIRMHPPSAAAAINTRLQGISRSDFEARVDVDAMKADGVADDKYWIDVGDPTPFTASLFELFEELRHVFQTAADQHGGAVVSVSI